MIKTWEQRAKELKFENGFSWTETYNMLLSEYPNEALSFERVRGYIRKTPEYKEQRHAGTNVGQHRKTVMINTDGTLTSDLNDRKLDGDLNDRKYLLTAHGFNPEEWEIAWAKNSIYNVQIKGGAVDTFYASKITVKPRTTPDADAMLKHFIDEAKKYSPVKPREISINKSGKLLLINISDLHLGMLAWAKESGESYDHKIAVERFKALVLDIIAKTSMYDYEKIVIVKGNDFFNTDNSQNTTTKGTQQFNDIRWQKMFDVGCDLFVWFIQTVAEHFSNTPIETELVEGNHDLTTSYYLAKYLWAFFKNDPSITIDISPMLHKGFAFGNTALLFTHGEAETKNLDWVYREFRHLIGETKVTEIHAGHEHRVRVEEKNGVFIYKNPSPSPLSSWAYAQGYNNVPQTITRIYDKTNGLIHQVYSKATTG